ncbi:MAG: (d)CMP kinase [Myxococcales bacterium]|nr:(d)CMP kinase [Myxococcales bacterium]
MSRRRPIVAIDGPAGAGKTSVARALAERLGWLRLDTGALYRAVALAARERGVDWNDGPALGRMVSGLDLEVEAAPGGRSRVRIDGRDRSDELRLPEIARGASDVSRHPEVRAALLDVQRRVGREGALVCEGRDIGTVVFPDAELKVFLTASPEERVRRRIAELRAMGVQVDESAMASEIAARDAQDSTRALAPLRPAPDAVVLDTTDMPLERVVELIAAHVARLSGGVAGTGTGPDAG